MAHGCMVMGGGGGGGESNDTIKPGSLIMLSAVHSYTREYTEDFMDSTQLSS